MKTVIHIHNYCTYVRIRIFYVSITNIYLFAGTYFIRNQTDPNWDRTVTEQMSIHRVLCLKGACLSYYNYLTIKNKSNFSQSNLFDLLIATSAI